MTNTIDALDQLGDAVLAELAAARPTSDPMGAAIAAAALASRRAADELAARDRIVRIARHEGATLRSLAEATGLSPQTIANICKH
jgi:hypothetical protein